MQVKDDLELLELMMEDTRKAPDLYRPGNYWSLYEKKGYSENHWNPLYPELKELGLHNFRRRKNSVITSFGGTDLSPSTSGKINISASRFFNNRITKKIPKWAALLSFMNRILNMIFPVSENVYHADGAKVGEKEIEQLFYDFAHIYGEKVGAKSVKDFEDSLIGNPEHIVEISNKVYTMRLLSYYLQYVYCYDYLNFNNIDIMVELGSGSGKQIEVIKKLHPDICFLLFDIPPTLYVCEQYLSSVFPDDVVSYRDTKLMDSIPEIHKGKILFLGTWKFPILNNEKVDLFWNSASFQEMEPDIISNYLKIINENSNAVFLRASMGGSKVAEKKGEHGVIESINLDNYKNSLSNFKLCDMSPSFWPINKRDTYSNSFWERI